MTHWPTGRLRILFRSGKVWAAAAALAAGGLVSTHLHLATLSIRSPYGVHQEKFWTFDTTWNAALAQSGVHLKQHDATSIVLTASIRTPLAIGRAVPVAVSTAHHQYRVWTTHYRVRQILNQLHIKLGPLDVVQPGLNRLVSGRTRIEVLRRWYVTRTVTQTLAYQTTYRPDPSMYVGRRALVQQGKDGTRVEVVKILMQDGQPIRRVVTENRVTTPVVPQVIAYGTVDTISRGGQVIYFSKVINMVATAYWPDPAWSSGYTATGIKAQYGVVAVDPAVIPLGTRLYIPGYGFAIAADTGGAIIGDRIDLCYDTASQAYAWGVQSVQVFVVK